MKKKTLFVLLIVASVVNGFIIVNAVMDLNATLYAATYFGLFSGMKEFATYLIYNNEVSSKFFAIKNWGDIIADIIEIIYLLFIEVMEICFIRRLQRNKDYIVPNLNEQQLAFIYANEADVLNVALFGMTAKQWRETNPTKKGNIRDYATIEQLLVIANMESYNAILIEKGISQRERLSQLNAMARSQLRIFQRQDTTKLLK